jgi:SAM-dependent methyltransferase
MLLPERIPAFDDYQRLLHTPVFRDMRAFSGRFLADNRRALAPYARKWVRDPLHNWSRQWEYPFTLLALSDHFSRRPATSAPRRILDAGSGVTFFPHYLASMITGSVIECIDLDRDVEKIFQAVVAERSEVTRFSRAGLDRVPFDDHAFDAVYCISVLEHLDNCHEALLEFRRVLKPEGALVVTFDISIDGTGEIPVDGAMELLSRLQRLFLADDPCPPADLPRLLEGEIVTTRAVGAQDRSLLPWGNPVAVAARNLLTAGRLSAAFPNLTVYCGRFVNRNDPGSS